jgi:Tfp pilus assembly protein PilO
VTDRTWGYIVLLIVAIGVGGWMVREPVLRPYAELAERAAEDRARTAELKVELARRQQSSGEVEAVLMAYGQPLSPTGRKARATAFYRRVESLVLSSGLQVQSLQPKPEQIDADGLLRFPIVVSLTGDMPGVVALLAQLRRTSGLIALENLALRRRDSADQPLTVQATLVSYAVADLETREELARAAAAKNKGK